MGIRIKAFDNADYVLIALEPDSWPAELVGLQLERKDQKTGAISIVNNRIPPKAGEGAIVPGEVSSTASPIRRCIWTDHGVTATEQLCYRVTAMNDDGEGGYAADQASVSELMDERPAPPARSSICQDGRRSPRAQPTLSAGG